MGTEGVYVPLILSAVAAAGDAYNKHRVASEQARIEDKRNRSAQRSQHGIDQQVNDEIAKMKASSGDAERKQSLEGYLQALRANKAAASGGPAQAGGSARYQADETGAQAAIGNYGTNRADILSRIVGPQQQRTNEQRSVGRTMGDVATNAQIAQMRDAMYQARAARVRANPWIDAGTNVLRAAAAGYGAAAGAAPSSADVIANQSQYGMEAANGVTRYVDTPVLNSARLYG